MSTPVTSPAYLPPGETAVQLFTERTLLDGAIMTGVVYGIHFSIFVQCAYVLIKELHRRRVNRVFLAYVIAMFILGTLFLASSSRVAQMTFIDDRNFPGGPVVWQEAAYSIPANLLGNVTFTIANWLADALMIWRCYIVWTGRYVWPVIAIPCLMWMASFAMGTILLTQVSRPGLSLWSTSSINFALTYFSISLSLNILVTLFILVRLLLHRREMCKSLGEAYGKYYVAIAAILVESAALYAACSILFLVPYVLNHPLQFIFMQILSQVQIIAPLLVIVRVASGHGLTTASLQTDANITFSSNPSYVTQSGLSGATAGDKSDITGNVVRERGAVPRGGLVVHFTSQTDSRSDGDFLTPVHEKVEGIVHDTVV